MAGYDAGGVVGIMVGAAFGDPPDAIAEGTLGALGGASIRWTTGLNENTYTVHYEDGTTGRFRSPNTQFGVNDQV